jgi:hypothetical protein
MTGNLVNVPVELRCCIAPRRSQTFPGADECFKVSRLKLLRNSKLPSTVCPVSGASYVSNGNIADVFWNIIFVIPPAIDDQQQAVFKLGSMSLVTSLNVIVLLTSFV